MEWQFGLKNIKVVAHEFWKKFGDKKIFAFYGDLGAGKTTFIHALCEVKHVTSAVASPTFSIINEYDSPAGKIFHIDLYRLKGEEEALRAGVEDCLYSNEICLLEWPQRAPGILPSEAVHVFIDSIDRETRKIHTDSRS